MNKRPSMRTARAGGWCASARFRALSASAGGELESQQACSTLYEIDTSPTTGDRHGPRCVSDAAGPDFCIAYGPPSACDGSPSLVRRNCTALRGTLAKGPATNLEMYPPKFSARSIAFPVGFETSWMALPASTRGFGSSVISSPSPARQMPRRRYRQGESRDPSSRDARRTSSGKPDARRPLPHAGCGRGPGDAPEGVSSCRFVKKYPEGKRDRILSDDEYRRHATTLGTPSAGGFALAVAIAATRHLMLAKCGNGEVLSLRRGEVALERSELRLRTGSIRDAPTKRLRRGFGGSPRCVSGWKRR